MEAIRAAAMPGGARAPITKHELKEQLSADNRRIMEFSPFLSNVGKIEVTKKASQKIIAQLMKANPHTLKIEGAFV